MVASATLMTWVLAAESKEWIGPVTALVNGVPEDTFQMAITAGSDRPATWEDTLTLNDGQGLLVGPGTGNVLAIGTKYTVWVKYVASPEIPIFRVGYIKVN